LPINNTEDIETTTIGANSSNENDITDVEGVEENNPINNTEDIETIAMDATATNKHDIVGGDGGEGDENNVSEEETDSAGGEGEGDDDEVSEEESGESVSEENLGGPYKLKCDTHGHIPGTFQCMVPLSTGQCGLPYYQLCLARNCANCIPYLPAHFEKCVLFVIRIMRFTSNIPLTLSYVFNYKLTSRLIPCPSSTTKRALNAKANLH